MAITLPDIRYRQPIRKVEMRKHDVLDTNPYEVVVDDYTGAAYTYEETEQTYTNAGGADVPFLLKKYFYFEVEQTSLGFLSTVGGVRGSSFGRPAVCQGAAYTTPSSPTPWYSFFNFVFDVRITFGGNSFFGDIGVGAVQEFTGVALKMDSYFRHERQYTSFSLVRYSDLDGTNTLAKPEELYEIHLWASGLSTYAYPLLDIKKSYEVVGDKVEDINGVIYERIRGYRWSYEFTILIDPSDTQMSGSASTYAQLVNWLVADTKFIAVAYYTDAFGEQVVLKDYKVKTNRIGDTAFGETYTIEVEDYNLS